MDVEKTFHSHNWLVSFLRDRSAVAFPPVIDATGSAQHSVDFVDETLLRLSLRLENLSAEVKKSVANLLNLLGCRDFVEFAVKVFRENLAFVGADLPQVNQIRFVA